MAASATGRAVGAATRMLAHALAGAVGDSVAVPGSQQPPQLQPAATAAWVCTPVYRNRTTEFCMFRNAAQRALEHAERYTRTQPTAPAPPPAPPAATAPQGWFAWLTGSGESEEAAPAAECPACGRRFGPTEPRRTCGTCGRTLCAHCAQTAVVGGGAVWCCCRACRPRVPPRVRAALFAQSVDDAAHTPLALLADGLRAAHARAAAEVAKLEYLADSLAAGTSGALAADPVRLAHQAGAIAASSSKQLQSRKTSKSNNTGTTYEAAVQQQQTATDALAHLNVLLTRLRGCAAGLTGGERAVAGLVAHRMAGAAAAWCATLRACTERLSTLELATATLVDVAVYRCCLEAQDNPRFAALFARPLADCERVVAAEMRAAADACSAVRWDAHRAVAKDAVFKWDAVCPSLISDEPSSLLPEAQRSSAVCCCFLSLPPSSFSHLFAHACVCALSLTKQNSAGSEGRMMRRTIAVLSKCLEFVEKRVGYVCPQSHNTQHRRRCSHGGGVVQGRLPKTKDALATLIDTVQRHFVI